MVPSPLETVSVFVCVFDFVGIHRPRSQDRRTALIWAARGGRTDCVRMLVEAGADKSATGDVTYFASVPLISSSDTDLSYVFVSALQWKSHSNKAHALSSFLSVILLCFVI